MRVLRAMGFAILVGILLGVGQAVGSDLRTRELLRLECRSDLGRQDTTLFGNGTARNRVFGIGDEIQMRLAELGPELVDEYQERIDAIRFPGSNRQEKGVSGEWVDQCVLSWTVSGEIRPQEFRFDRFAALPLQIALLHRAAEEIRLLVDTEAQASQLSPSYRPALGDRLLRFDGESYQVVALSADGKGVELRGVRTPFTLYLQVVDLPTEFLAKINPESERTER